MGDHLSGEVWQSRVVNERADGERYVVDQTIAPVMDGDEVQEFVAVNAEVGSFEDADRTTSRAAARGVLRNSQVPMLLASADRGSSTRSTRPQSGCSTGPARS